MPIGLDVGSIETRLRAAGTARRAAGSKAYLKSNLDFAGNDVATLRREARAWLRAHPDAPIGTAIRFAQTLWKRRVFELRILGLEVLVARADDLAPSHLTFLERLLRDSHTWALVDVIAPRLVGPLLLRHPASVGRALDRWARDPDFWIRRSALLALLLPMRRGEGDWRRFQRYADPLLADREFFIRKSIGWVLREAAVRAPERVVAFVEPRAPRLSGVTWREAVRKLPAKERRRLEQIRAAGPRREGATRRASTP